jgi:chorismate synthase
MQKYDWAEARPILERASARETAARVALGAVASAFLAQAVDARIVSHVVKIGTAEAPYGSVPMPDDVARLDDDPVRCLDPDASKAMVAEIDQAHKDGDTLGGVVEVVVDGLPPGLGSYVHWDRKLDGRLAQAVMSIPAIKAVGLGRASAVGHLPGSKVHDEILPADGAASGTVPGLRRPTNNAGGLEGGVTNGEDVRVTAWMKPISTLMKPLRSVDLATLTEAAAAIERSDVCAVPAAAVVGESVVAFVLADALLEKLGADSVGEIDSAWARLTSRLAERLTPHREPI